MNKSALKHKFFLLNRRRERNSLYTWIRVHLLSLSRRFAWSFSLSSQFTSGLIGLSLVFLALGFLTGWTLPAGESGFKRHLFGPWTYSADIKQTGMQVALGTTQKNANIQVTRGTSSLQFTLPIEKSAIRSNSNGVSYEVPGKQFAVEYSVTPNGLKEQIVLNKIPDTPTFNSTFTTKDAQVRMSSEGIPVFYDSKGQYAFHFDKPFMKDAKGAISYGVSYRLVPQSSPISQISPTSFLSRDTNNPDDFDKTAFNSKVKGKTERKLLASAKPLNTALDGTYTLEVLVDQAWLKDPKRTLPIIIDPTVIHDTSSEFGGGTMNRTKDTGSGSSPIVESYYQPLAADAGTVGLWHMDDSSGTVTDSSGNSNNGTAVGTTIINGRVGTGARTFNGISDYITVSNSTSLAIRNDITIEAWVKRTASNNYDTILTKTNGSTRWDYDFYIWTDGTLEFYSDATSPTNVSSTSTITDTNWHHVAITRLGGRVTFYIDGIPGGSATMTGTMNNNTDPVIIGTDYTNTTTTDHLNGTLDEVRLSNIARTPEEIKANASRPPYAVYTSSVINLGKVTSWNNFSWTEQGVQTGDGETVNNSTSLVSQWNFNSTSGTTAANNAGASTCGGTGTNCDFTLNNFASTGSQDAAAGTGWTANNKRWGAGALSLSSAATADSLSRADPSGNALDPNSSDMTIATWVKSIDTSAEIFSNNNANGTACTNNGYYVGIDSNGYPVFNLDTNGGTAGCDGSITGTVKVNDGQWHNIAISVTRGTSAIMYLDGAQIGIDTSITSYSGTTVTGTVYIGGSAGGYDGVIDSTSFYTRALPGYEIVSNYNNSDIEFETRVGATTDPNDGTWEAWKPTTSETQIDSLDGPYQYNTTDTGIVSYWPLDENLDNTCSGGTNDSCDKKGSVDLAATGSKILDGKYGKARYFNGSSDYLSATSTPSTAVTNWSMEAWVNPASINQGGFFMYNGNDNGGYGFGIGDAGGGSGAIFNGLLGGLAWINSGYSFPTANRWYHVVMTRDTTTIRLYVNGVQTPNTNASTPNSVTTRFSVGMQFNGSNTPSRYFNGNVDEPRFYTTTLSAATILQHYQEGIGEFGLTSGSMTASTSGTIKAEGTGSLKIQSGAPTLDGSTVALWHMDETSGSGAYIMDASSNNNHCTPTGTTLTDGFVGKGRSFNGSSDSLSCGVTNRPSNTFTMEAWFTVNATHEVDTEANSGFAGTSGQNYLFYPDFRGGGTSNDAGAGVSIGTNGISVYEHSDAYLPPLAVYNGTVPAGWNHVAVVYNAKTPSIYLNGQLVRTGLASPKTNVYGPSIIGGSTYGYHNGKADEIKISNIARTADEIAEEYRAGRDHRFGRNISSTDVSSKTKIPFYVASDRQGRFMEATIGNNAFSNYETDANTGGFWHMEEATGSAQTGCATCFLAARDSSGNEKNGYWWGSGTGSSSFTQGKIGRARTFNGSGDQMVINDTTTPTAYTYDMWVYPQSTSNQNIFVRSDNGGPGSSYSHQLRITSSKFEHYTFDGSGRTVTGISTVTANQWYHLAITATNGGAMELYVNGVKEGTFSTLGTLWASGTRYYIGSSSSGYSSFNGIIDEARYSNTARSAADIRAAYEIGKRTHPVVIDFKAKADSGNLITSSSDTSFTIDGTSYGAVNKADKLYVGDKVIVKENVSGVEYIAQGTVATVTSSTGAVTVESWDSGGTFPGSGYTANATFFKWQQEWFDVTGSLSTQRNALTRITLRENDSTQGSNVFLDDFRYGGAYLSSPTSNTITSSTGYQYMQYRTILSTTNTATSSALTSATVRYVDKTPIGQWKFDEGYGTTAYDSSGNGYNGTLVNSPSWTTEERCVSEKCLKFTSSGATYITTGSRVGPTNGFSISLWVNPSSVSITQLFASQYDGTNAYFQLFATNSDVTFRIHQTMDVNYIGRTASSKLIANKWQHIEATWNGTTSSSGVKIYINGIQVDTTNDQAGTFTSPNSNAIDFQIGAQLATTNANGFIDNVKAYGYGRSTAEVLADYNEGTARNQAVKGASASIGGDTTQTGPLSNGLVGYWKLDESASPAVDASGNGNSGTWTGGATKANGKFGNSVTLDGSGDYVSIGDPSSGVLDFGTGDFSLAAWFYVPSLPGNYKSIINKGASGTGGYGLTIDSSNRLTGDIQATSGGSNQHVTSATAGITAGVWQHGVAVFSRNDKVYVYLNGELVASAVYDSGNTGSISNSSNFLLGSYTDGSAFQLNGKIDEARVYNRALSNKEVRDLYNYGPGPIGYWKLDEQTGTTANDSSSNANTGTLAAANWTTGKFGSAASFNGTTDTISIANESNFDFERTDAFSISLWTKLSVTAATQILFGKMANVAIYTGYELFIDTNNKINVQLINTYPTNLILVTGSTNLGDGKWHHIEATYSGSSAASGVTVYIDGKLETMTTTNDTLSATILNNISPYLGSRNNTAFYFGGKIDDVKVYNYARNQKQVVQDMNAGHPGVGSPIGHPIGYWKFDDGYGTIASNSGSLGSTLNGTLTSMDSPPKSPSGWTNGGKFNKGIDFDGSNDYVNLGDQTAYELQAFTISAWVNKSSGNCNGFQDCGIFSKGTSGNSGFRFGMSGGSPTLFMNMRDLQTVQGTTTLSSNRWYHVAVTIDGSTVKLYIDGRLEKSAAETTVPTYGGESAKIGIANSDLGFKGTIDEVKFYNYVLSSDEMQLEYNQGKSVVFGAISTDSNGTSASNSASRDYCIPGDTSTCNSPIGEWKMDENTGTIAFDTSGNGSTGAFVSSPQWVPGKKGSAVKMNGTSDYITLSHPTALNATTTFTLSAWINASSSVAGSGIISEAFAGGGDRVQYTLGFGADDGTDNKLQVGFYDGSGWAVAEDSTAFTSTNTWVHVEGTWDGTTLKLYKDGVLVATNVPSRSTATDTEDIRIGSRHDTAGTVDFFPGTIDDVRIYNYTRSAAQVAWEYNRGGPVGWWRFDECTGSTAYDASGKSNNGTITIAATGSEDTIGNCTTSSTAWGTGASGKLNNSISLDGTDDYITAGSPSNLGISGDAAYTVSAWVYPLTTFNRNDAMVFSYGGATNGHVISVGSDGSGKIYSVHYGNDHAYTKSWTASAWQHVLITYDPNDSSGTEKLYVNGVYVESWNPSNLSITASESLNIGRSTWNSVYVQQSQIDDVRLYNYPLTANQARTLYNEAAIKFGPVTGAP